MANSYAVKTICYSQIKLLIKLRVFENDKNQYFLPIIALLSFK